MTYSHDPSTDEGLLRTLVNDTDSTDYEFEDSELTAVLDVNDSDVWAAAADLCRSLAAKFAKEAISLELSRGDLRIDKKKKAAYFLDLAKLYASRSGSDVGEYIDSFNYQVSSGGFDTSEYIGDD